MPITRTLTALAAAALLASCATLDDQPPATTITAMPGLGTATFAVTAQDPQARAWFAQGLQLLWAFEHREAVRVFRAALARDPSCAMCAWGVAYALGPNINNPDRGPVRDIRRYIERAQQAAAGASPVERALIQAMAVRYGRAPDKDQQLYQAQGAALMEARKLDEAAQAVAESQRLNGPSAWVHQALAQLAERRGALAESKQQAELARVAWRNAQGASWPRL